MSDQRTSFQFVIVILLVLTFSSIVRHTSAVTKVIVPSVYKDWKTRKPEWATNLELQRKYNYTVFMYQKLNASKPNFISRNRGTEGAVYLRFIVDHYDKFPDIAVFTHADPEAHQPNWLEMIGCVHENATYSNFNIQAICRDTTVWKKSEVWVEQCWRDVLKIAFGLQNNAAEFNQRVPSNRPILVCGAQCCQQFIISRAQIHKRPLHVWRALLKIIGEQDVCHIGEPDYDSLYAYNRYPLSKRVKVGPELPNIQIEGENSTYPGYGTCDLSVLRNLDLPFKSQEVSPIDITTVTTGRHTQGGAMEHLAHVIFGLQDLDTENQNNAHYCANYLPNSICPGSPCKG